MTAKRQPQNIADEIISSARNSRPGFAAWHEELPDDVAAELRLVREKWQRGDLPLQKRALARSVIAVLRGRGIKVTGNQGVEKWLTSKD